MLFTALMAVLVLSAVMVVRSANLVHSVFWLGATLLATAVVYVTLEAPFIAGIQVLLYAGGVITLMLFGVMLTQRDPDVVVPNPMHRQGLAAVVAGAVLVVLLVGIWSGDAVAGLTAGSAGTTQEVGELFLRTHLLAFEVLSVLLLAAMIGAIVLARKADP